MKLEYIGFIFFVNVGIALSEWQRVDGTNVVTGLISSPSEADGIDIFNFGEIFDFTHDECERKCKAKSGCVAYTQFASWHADINFFVACVGRSNAYDVNETDVGTLSGFNLDPQTIPSTIPNSPTPTTISPSTSVTTPGTTASTITSTQTTTISRWQRTENTNVVKGLVAKPSEANGISVFNFGQIYDFSHDKCEKECEAKSGCVAYTQFASYHSDPNFFSSCMGRSNAYVINEADNYTLSGIDPDAPTLDSTFTTSPSTPATPSATTPISSATTSFTTSTDSPQFTTPSFSTTDSVIGGTITAKATSTLVLLAALGICGL